MKLNDNFNQFVKNISLNPTREERIISAVKSLKEFFESNEDIKSIYYEAFLQGSAAISTAIKPIEGEEFDADVVLVLDLNDEFGGLRDPEEVLKFIKEILKNNSFYKDKIKIKNRCLRINYAGDFHLDVVPTHSSGDSNGILQIPCKADNEENWQYTNPKGFIKWCNETELNSNNKFSRITKMLKHWRNIKFGKDSAPKSILLTTIIGQNIEGSFSSDAESLLYTMENINGYLNNQIFVPFIANPSLDSEDLARGWSSDNFELFKKRFSCALEKASLAFKEEDKDKSISLWQDLFGDKFPSLTEENGKKMAEAIKSNTIFVTSLGTLTDDSKHTITTSIRPHRFYGD